MADNSTRILTDRIASLNDEVRGWSKGTKEGLLRKLASMGLKDRLEVAKVQSKIRIKKGKGGISTQREQYLYPSVGATVRTRSGSLEGVAFSFARHGAFLEHGVGRGRKQGSSAALKAQKKSGAPWVQPVIDPAVEKLAALLEEKYADIAAGEIKITVPGLDSRVVKIGN